LAIKLLVGPPLPDILKEELNKERYCCPSGVYEADILTMEKLHFLETQAIGEAMAWK